VSVRKWYKSVLIMIIAILALTALSACGGSKSDVDVFIMPKTTLPNNAAVDIQKSLRAKLGTDKTIVVTGSPIYNIQKMMLEYAAGEHDVFVLPKADFLTLVKEGGAIPLDDAFDPASYPEGVMDGMVTNEDNTEAVEKHLFGIPLDGSKMFKDIGYDAAREELYIIVFVRAKDKDYAKQVVKEIVQS
jgi:ABC-type glycerol-3-phosphate transport system substrate-binding protein